MSIEVCKNWNKNQQCVDSMKVVCVKQVRESGEASRKWQGITVIESELSFSMVSKTPKSQTMVSRKDSIVSGDESRGEYNICYHLTTSANIV